jgi:hypothetical protein
MNVDTIDFAVDSSGNLLISETGDILTCSGISALQQEIAIRLKTVKGDNAYFPNSGTELNSLIGSANSPDTANKGEKMIISSLTFDNLLTPDNIEIISYADDPNSIIFNILIDVSSYSSSIQYLSYSITLDLKEGSILI